MEKYIGIYEKSLDSDYCDYLINLFENNSNKVDGSVKKGVDKNVKDTTDLRIDTSSNDKAILEIEEKLSVELFNKLEKYAKALNDTFDYSFQYKFFHDTLVSNNHGFQLQRYLKGIGKYIYHHDFLVEWDTRTNRIITFLWYLNDVDEGGETEFFGNYKIKPEKGKLVFFPATWAFPHRGCVPLSSNKYIITGWLYEGIQNSKETNLLKYENALILENNDNCVFNINTNELKENVVKTEI
jgi:hypothetical protein